MEPATWPRRLGLRPQLGHERFRREASGGFKVHPRFGGQSSTHPLKFASKFVAHVGTGRVAGGRSNLARVCLAEFSEPEDDASDVYSG